MSSASRPGEPSGSEAARPAGTCLPKNGPPLFAVLVTCGVVLCPTFASGQDASLDTILSRAATYAALFFERFSNVVTEERYVQTMDRQTTDRRLSAGASPQDRVLRSDVIFVNGSGPLDGMMLRDVFEVNGAPVRDREERLTRLFQQPASTALAQANRIATESARYNLGPGDRTTNTPDLAILFLQRPLQPRFTFSLGSRDRSEGEQVWTVNYRERGRPTVITHGTAGDIPASGRFWIDAGTGRVVRTSVTLRLTGGFWLLETTFEYDERFGIAVPTEMRERLEVDATRLLGIAKYGRFRSFSVTTDSAVKTPNEEATPTSPVTP